MQHAIENKAQAVDFGGAIDELKGLFRRYVPGHLHYYSITLKDFEGKRFLAKVYYRLAFFNHVSIERVESADGCDITLCGAVLAQNFYLRQRAESDILNRQLGGPAVRLREIDLATFKNSRL